MGTTYHLVASIVIGDTHVGIKFDESAKAGAARGPMKLALDTPASEEGIFEWSDAPKLRLERQLDAVARRILELAEQRLRANAQYQYEWALERQADLRRKIREEEEAAERKRLAALEAQQQRVRGRLYRLAANLRKAREIRELVAVMEQRAAGQRHPGAVGGFRGMEREGAGGGGSAGSRLDGAAGSGRAAGGRVRGGRGRVEPRLT